LIHPTHWLNLTRSCIPMHYNGFQIAVNALAVFTAGAASTMKCFVAGTLILTSAGLVAIENIKAGDKVIATNPETFEVGETEAK